MSEKHRNDEWIPGFKKQIKIEPFFILFCFNKSMVRRASAHDNQEMCNVCDFDEALSVYYRTMEKSYIKNTFGFEKYVLNSQLEFSF